MISLIHYISACKRLKESNKTIQVLGGDEECNDMMLAQREMIAFEKEYYRGEVMKLAISIVIVAPVILICFELYNYFK